MKQEKYHGAKGSDPGPALRDKERMKVGKISWFDQGSLRGIGHNNDGDHDFIGRKPKDKCHKDYPIHPHQAPDRIQISAKACGRKKAYEEMVNVMYKISGGASEGECYEEYGIRCNLSEYRKFGMMLSQNLRKGTRGLTELLEREAEDAFEQRKNLAKKAGEEAGTKLMIPLFLMLIIVFAIVIVPAFFSIRI